jgi:tRNA-Thr(GGU) m(6)t(6)A37 methyltransferase TsaA
VNGSGLDIIARIETPFAEKFGVPRQSGIADCPGRIVFEKPFRDVDAVRGLEGFSHIWLIWQFDRALRQGWSPTVRPPRLGGNERVGVFATRSPFRPNGLGLSAVELERVALDEPEGPVLYVRGADMVSGTPIVDIKPYLAYADSYPDAAGDQTRMRELIRRERQVELCFENLRARFDSGQRHGLLSALAADPRPRYQDDPDRVYGMAYAGKNVRFTVQDGTVRVVGVE